MMLIFKSNVCYNIPIKQQRGWKHEIYYQRKNITVTEGLKTAVEDKLGKLERYFTPDTEVVVTLSVEKERQKIEVTIPVKGNIIRSEQVSNDMYVSIDLVEEVIERQLRKYKNKIVDKQQAKTKEFKKRLEKGETLDDLLPEALCCCK